MSERPLRGRAIRRLWDAPRPWRYIAVATIAFSLGGVGVAAAASVGITQIGFGAGASAANGTIATVANGSLQVGTGGKPTVVTGVPATQFSTGMAHPLGATSSGAGARVTLHGPDPGGTTYAISSVMLQAPAANTQVETVYVTTEDTVNGSCMDNTGTQDTSLNMSIAPGATQVMTFPQPFLVTEGTASNERLCLNAEGGMAGNDLVYVGAIGYTQ